MKRIYLLVLIFSCSFLYNCNKDNKEIDVRYTTNDLQLLHNNSSKTWEIEHFFQNYEDDILSEFNDCYIDDKFTFFYDNNNLEAELGNKYCFYENPTEQYATFTYVFYENEGKIFLHIGRGESSDEKFRTRIFTLELEELSETRMVFASGEYPNYGKTLIFKSTL